MRRAPAWKPSSSCREDVPMANRLECEIAGAQVTLVDGLITDCARMVQQRKDG